MRPTGHGTRQATRLAHLGHQSATLALSDLGYADDYATVAGGRCPLPAALASAQCQLTAVERESAPANLGTNHIKMDSIVISNGKSLVCPASKSSLRLQNGQGFPQSADFKYLGSSARTALSDIRARLRSGWSTLRSASRFFHSDAVSDDVKMRVFQTLIQTVFLYACQSWVLGDKERATLQGSYTRMLRFAKNIPFTDHPSLERIYGATPSVLATIAKYRLHMLGTAFRYERECPQPLIRVVRWLLSQHTPVTSTLTPRAREQRFTYADQLMRDVRCLTRRPGMRPDEVLSLLSSPTDWRTKVIDQVVSQPRLFLPHQEDGPCAPPPPPFSVGSCHTSEST